MKRGDRFFMGHKSFRHKYFPQQGSSRLKLGGSVPEEPSGVDPGNSMGRPVLSSSAFIRFLALVGMLVAGSIAAGCVTSGLKATSARPVDAGMEIYVRSLIQQHAMDTLCMLAFSTPPEMAAASASLTSAFQSRLQQKGVFRQIRVLPCEANSDSEAVWRARDQGCTLVMCPVLIYMRDGTGGMPTELEVRTRILDARTGGVLWDVKQRGTSEPGPDIDLTWDTFEGDPAQRCHVLADSLARRFAEYLVQSQSD